MTGTARYASVNTHLGYEQGRRDDMESIGNVLLYFITGHLPWQGLKAKTKKEKYDKIRQVKSETSLDKLCEGAPKEMLKYFKYIRSLKFESMPDYSYLKKLFRRGLKQRGLECDYNYDWVMKKEKRRVPNENMKAHSPKQPIGDLQTAESNSSKPMGPPM